ncbi:unnamed protein product [Cochlearia groenlandica]
MESFIKLHQKLLLTNLLRYIVLLFRRPITKVILALVIYRHLACLFNGLGVTYMKLLLGDSGLGVSITLNSSLASKSLFNIRTHYSTYPSFEDVGIEAKAGFVGKEASTRAICFDTATTRHRPFLRIGRRKSPSGNIVKPERREDGWMKIELGEFFI